MAEEEDPNEAAARRLQEQIWLQEAEDNELRELELPNNNNPANNNNNNAGGEAAGGGGNERREGRDAMQDFVQQLLNQNAAAMNNNNEEDEEGNNNNDPPEEDEEENNEEEEENDDSDGDEAEAIDGGIAGEVRDENSIKITRSLKCPLVLYFEIADKELQSTTTSPSNPVLKLGTTVYIGLDKNTKLSTVFEQYVKFVNSKKKKPKGSSSNNKVTDIKMSDLEFMHVQLLDATQTVEASAMMKNDHIKVYKERSKERQTKIEIIRQQRESDRKYFNDLRQLLPNPSLSDSLPFGSGGGSNNKGGGCDVVLDCRGKLKDEGGRSQAVLATTVRANSVVISKRCKWLGLKISSVKEDARRRAEMTVDVDEDVDEQGGDEKGAPSNLESQKSSGMSDDEEDDDIIMGEEGAVANRRAVDDNNAPGSGVSKVEDYDEDDDNKPPAVKVKAAKKKSPASSGGSGGGGQLDSASSSAFPNSIWVSLDHSPQAVKLLLEYCYTNRVQSLGQEAFVKGSKYPIAKEVGPIAKHDGPVPPYKKHDWPMGGSPTVSLYLALAGITLAEEAHMPRLSLMCEIAASQLVNEHNVIDVLCACQVQQQSTGNRLPILRKAAMLDCIYNRGSSGVESLSKKESFKNGIEERRGLVISSLLDGTIEVMPTNMMTKAIQKKKDKREREIKTSFETLDNADKNRRLMERIKWRQPKVVTRRQEVAYGHDSKAIRMPARRNIDLSSNIDLSTGSATNIWRDVPHRDPPPLHQSSTSTRGTKRKKSSALPGEAPKRRSRTKSTSRTGGESSTRRTTRTTRKTRSSNNNNA